MDLFDCTVFGDVFLDVIIHVNCNHTRFFRGGTSYCDSAKIVLGGSGNIAVGLSYLGGKVAFVGKAGDDISGTLYMQNLRTKGVASRVFFDKAFPTGLVISFVDRKDRSLLVFRGANDKLSTEEIEKTVEEIRRSKYIYFSGYSLVNEPQKSAILRAVEIAKRFKAKIVFDPGAYNVVKSKQKFFAKLLDVCDIFSPNLDEAMAITNTKNIADAINELISKVPLTALKCGGKGCILITKKNIVKVPSVKVKCLDPTGAGDAFTAALIYGLAHELPLQATGQLANWFAAQVVTRIGPRSFPTKSRINRFLSRLTVKTTLG